MSREIYWDGQESKGKVSLDTYFVQQNGQIWLIYDALLD